MQTYKTILVQLDKPESAQSVLGTALLVAKKSYGHLDVCHVVLEPSCLLPVPVVSADMAGFVVNDVVEAEKKVFEQNADETRIAFENFLEEHAILPRTEPQSHLKEVTAQYRETIGCEEEVIAWCSRVTDIVVMPRPNTSQPSFRDSFAVLNAAIMESGSAILIAPKQAPETVGEKIVIAWDATQETAKAVTLAMPFLIKAKEVVILETETPSEQWADSSAIAARLIRQGVEVEVVKMTEFSSVSAKGAEVVKFACGRYDMLVTGAFTQSTMRRWILGSMTKYLIENADISLFLAH